MHLQATMDLPNNWLFDYQNIVSAIVGVGLGAFVAAIGWHVNRLYRKSDDHDARIAALEARMPTKDDLKYLEGRFETDLREMERRIDRNAERTLEGIERVNGRLDSLLSLRNRLDGT